jgi:hypothetical protein
MSEIDKNENTNHWIRTTDSALLILILTATSYAMAFEYQSGYLSHFDLPRELVEVNINSLIVSAGALFATAVALFYFIGIVLKLIAPLVKTWHPEVRRRVIFLVVLIVLTAGFEFYLNVSILAAAIGVVFPLIMLLGELLMPLIAYRSLPTYAAKLEASVKDDMRRPKGPDVELVRSLVFVTTPSIAGLLLAAFMSSLFSYAIGVNAAETQKVFLVPDGVPPCALIRSLSQGLLCVSFDASTKKASGEFRFIKAEGATLHLREIGPLKEPKL